MKHTYLFLLAIIPVFSFAQRGQVGVYMPIDIPVKSVMPKMSTNVGIGAQFGYKPLAAFPMLLEFKASTGSYCSRTLQQTYVFDSQSQTTTDVTYTSAMNRLNLGAKFYIGNDYRPVRGFITPQIGMAFLRSKIVIADPMDEDDCKALERKTMQRNSGMTYGGEAGVEVSFGSLFKNASSDSKHRLYASVSFTQSFRPFNYVNVKYMQDHDHGNMSPGTAEDRDVTTQFINVSTNQVHEHKIAELYRTDLRFIGINVGYVFTF